MRFSWSSLVLLVALFLQAAADTEIINFVPELSPYVNIDHLVRDWRILSPRDSAIIDIKPAPRHSMDYISCNFTKELCPHEVWLALSATSNSKHTVRISYPATSSVKFKMEMISHQALSEWIHEDIQPVASSSTQATYLRIMAQRIGVLTPTVQYTEPSTLSFHVCFERLLFGVVPPTILPVLAAIIIVLALVTRSLPRLFTMIDALAKSARTDMKKRTNE